MGNRLSLRKQEQQGFESGVIAWIRIRFQNFSWGVKSSLDGCKKQILYRVSLARKIEICRKDFFLVSRYFKELYAF